MPKVYPPTKGIWYGGKLADKGVDVSEMEANQLDKLGWTVENKRTPKPVKEPKKTTAPKVEDK